MSTRNTILHCFGAEAPSVAPSPLLLLDLTLWHKWHLERGTLPPGWETSLIEAARALGTPVWAPFKPWRTEYDGIDVTTDQTEVQRDIIYRVADREMLARWTLGPDGDWWQTDYPVKTPEDLESMVEVAAARRYVVDPDALDEWRKAVGDDGVVPLELPMRPYSDLLHTMVGWGQGLTLTLGEGKALVSRIVACLEETLGRLVDQLAALEPDLLLAPDNLDGQYISPRAFKQYLAPSYEGTARAARGKPVVVHVGGPARRLVPLLAQAGVAAIEGIAGPPQGDATLAEAREVGGPEVTLWGGIPQDFLIEEHGDEEFEAAVAEALEQAQADGTGRALIGVADRVPVAAELGRLRRLVEMLG